jgi:MinD superfamily P-loop ATPase
MKELVIISGKGGTGKTTIAAAFATLAENKVVADCDVDAADLHIIMTPEVQEQGDFIGGKVPRINKELCTQCGLCRDLCRFDAITEEYLINKVNCEGCGVCFNFCPEKAIDFNQVVSGKWFISNTRFGPLIHAKLGIAEENSGKLVSLVRQKAKIKAEEEKHELIIIDGAPGIGCPVISCITGTDLILIVTEPTLSGIHDLKRTVELANHFGISSIVCINKFDLNTDMTKSIERYCYENKIKVMGKIPFDEQVVRALIQKKSISEHSSGIAAKAVKEMWQDISQVLFSNEKR